MLNSKHFPVDEHYCTCGHPWGYHGQGRGCSMPLGPSGLPHGRNEPLVGTCPCDADKHGNRVAQEGCDKCWCGVKYWENDVCVNGHPFIERIGA